jgi:hypothetical protein
MSRHRRQPDCLVIPTRQSCDRRTRLSCPPSPCTSACNAPGARSRPQKQSTPLAGSHSWPLLAHAACGAACPLFSARLVHSACAQRTGSCRTLLLFCCRTLTTLNSFRKLTRLRHVCGGTCAGQIKRAKCALSGLSGLRADKQGIKQRRLFSKDKQPSASLGAPSCPLLPLTFTPGTRHKECKGHACKTA